MDLPFCMVPPVGWQMCRWFFFGFFFLDILKTTREGRKRRDGFKENDENVEQQREGQQHRW